MSKRSLHSQTLTLAKATVSGATYCATVFTLLFCTSNAQAQVGQQLSGISSENLVHTMPVDSVDRKNSLQQVENYNLAIDELEAQQGAWGEGLSEQLAGLGKAYQLRGEHDEAIAVFERAIHVNRINNGLYDLSQVDLIENMLDSLLVTGQWKEVHERQQYLYWIHQRNYGDNDPRMLPVIDRLGSWYINDYALNPKNRYIGHLVDAHNLFSQATQIIENQYGDSDLRMIVPLRGLVLSNWFLWTFASQNPGLLTAPGNYGDTTIGSSLAENPARLAPYVRNNYANGKAALDRMVEIYSDNPDSPPGSAAAAKIELADWHMLGNRPRSANELYHEAYQSLVADNQTLKQAEKIFSRPVALPDLVLLESDVERYNQRDIQSQSSNQAANYVLVSYDVNRFGEARNIDIIESFPEDDVGMRARVKRSLSNTRFRPRIVDGEPVDSQGLVQKYVFSQQ